MKTLKQFINESSNNDVHAELERMGVKKVTRQGYGADKELPLHKISGQKFEDIHKVLTKHGYKMNTHYRQGGVMPKYTSYSKDVGPYTEHHVGIDQKHGWVNFSSHTARD